MNNHDVNTRYRPRFFNQVGIKSCMHLWEISIFSINNVVRPTKIKTEPTKIGHILENKVL